MLTMDELVAETGLSRRTINRLVQEGGIAPPHRRPALRGAHWGWEHLAGLRSYVDYAERHRGLMRRPDRRDPRGRFTHGNGGGRAINYRVVFCQRQCRARAGVELERPGWVLSRFPGKPTESD